MYHPLRLFRSHPVTPRAERRQGPVHRPGAAPWVRIGLLLLVAFWVQAALDLRWDRLLALQADETYKQLSGLALVVWLAAQWRLSAARMRHRGPISPDRISTHLKWGAIAPLLFYLHSVGIGHAYTALLSLTFYGVLVLGLLQSDVVRLQRPWLTFVWRVSHIALAVVLTVLLSYHAFITLYYE